MHNLSVDLDRMDAHAPKLRDIGEDISEAKVAIDSMNLGGGAFGVLCSFLVPPAQLATAVAGSMVHECAELMQRAATQVQTASRSLRGCDQALADDARAFERRSL